MGRTPDLMEEDAKRAMSMWKARQSQRALKELLWALETSAEAERMQVQAYAPKVMQCSYCGGSCYEGESCGGCAGRQFLCQSP